MKFRKGDTLIEVLLAIAVFAVVMLIGLSTMNNGMSRALASLQLTMARNAMDTQAEALRFANGAFLSEYKSDDTGSLSSPAILWRDNLTQGAQGSATPLESCTRGSSAFVIATRDMGNNRGYRTNNISSAITYPRISYGDDADTNANWLRDGLAYRGAEGIWVEKVHVPNTRYYDFHIRACWSAPGSNVNTTLGTIVRLYDPRD